MLFFSDGMSGKKDVKYSLKKHFCFGKGAICTLLQLTVETILVLKALSSTFPDSLTLLAGSVHKEMLC